MTQETPQHGDEYEEGCTFLGRYQVGEARYDLWYSSRPGEYEPTLVARWSPDGPDYSSGLGFGWIEEGGVRPLVEARKRAEALGLDVRREQYAGKMRRHSSGMYYTVGQEAQVAELFGAPEDHPDD